MLHALPNERLVSLPEVARRLGLHRATVNAMVQDGRLHGTRVGAHWYVSSEDVERFAASYQRPKNSPTRRPAKDPLVGNAGRVRDILATWDAGTADEMAQALDLHPGNVRKHLCLLEKRGFVRRTDEGLWTTTSTAVAL